MDLNEPKPGGSQLIPLLFTLGVIGWGFYAIEKLSPPAEDELGVSNVGTGSWVKQSQERQGIRRWLLDEIEEMSSDKRPESIKESAENLEIIANDQAYAGNDQIVPSRALEEESSGWTQIDDDLSQGADQEAVATPQSSRIFMEPGDRLFSVYYYVLSSSGTPELRKFQRSTNSLGVAKAALTHLIHGARDSGALETFPIKPEVRSINVSDKVLVIDFDQNFGIGVSTEIFLYQLQQIHKTLTQLSTVNAISIRINGQVPTSIGSHGIRLPEKITAGKIQSLLPSYSG